MIYYWEIRIKIMGFFTVTCAATPVRWEVSISLIFFSARWTCLLRVTWVYSIGSLHRFGGKLWLMGMGPSSIWKYKRSRGHGTTWLQSSLEMSAIKPAYWDCLATYASFVDFIKHSGSGYISYIFKISEKM